MSNTTSTIHWSYYTMGFIAAIIIGIDSAVNSVFYMSMMGGFYAIPIVIISCAIAGAILNTILYANDFPEAISELKHNTKELLISIYNWRTVLDNFNAKSTDEKKSAIYHTSIYIGKEMVAMASGIMLGLFTYSAYMEMHIAWMSAPLVILFSAAYLFGTYALIRISLNAEYADGETVTQKLKSFSRIQLIAVSITVSIFIMASVWTIFTFYAGALTAIHAISPALAPVTPLLFVLLLIGESIFSVKTAIWLCSKLNQEKNTPRQHPLRNLFINTITILNGLANAAITSYGSSKITGYTGFLLSVGVMYKSSHEIDIEKQKLTNQEAEAKTHTIKKAQVMALYIIATTAIIWLLLDPIPTLAIWAPTLIVSLIALCMGTTMFLQGKIDILGMTSQTNTALSTTQLEPLKKAPVSADTKLPTETLVKQAASTPIDDVQKTAKEIAESATTNALQKIAG